MGRGALVSALPYLISPSVQARACGFIEMALFIKEEFNSQLTSLFQVAVSGGDRAAVGRSRCRKVCTFRGGGWWVCSLSVWLIPCAQRGLSADAELRSVGREAETGAVSASLGWSALQETPESLGGRKQEQRRESSSPKSSLLL